MTGNPTYPPPGKTAIVTGASSGIGRSSAIALARAGWNVMATGRRRPELDETASLAAGGTADAAAATSSPPGKVECFVADVTQEQAVVDLFKATLDRFGRVDLVFCNAGISPAPVPLAEQALSDWNACVSTNLTATYLCAREAFRVMTRREQPPTDAATSSSSSSSSSSPSSAGKGRGGRIIINGSISAHAPRPHSEAYTATKHALTGLTKCLSLDGRKWDIAVSQVDIGNAASAMTETMSSGPGVQQADGSFRTEPTMDREWAAKEIVHIAEMPLGVNVAFVTIQATKMPSFVGRG